MTDKRLAEIEQLIYLRLAGPAECDELVSEVKRLQGEVKRMQAEVVGLRRIVQDKEES